MKNDSCFNARHRITSNSIDLDSDASLKVSPRNEPATFSSGEMGSEGRIIEVSFNDNLWWNIAYSFFNMGRNSQVRVYREFIVGVLSIKQSWKAQWDLS